MYLKKLSLQGFKSFANRTNIEFESGITAIVGPNGSGKSNIADAIRWILGEQRIKNLRGSKLEDVVFAGSQGSKPVGMAEVSIVLDNSDARLNLDYSEVSVARRVYRSGDSEFLINNSPCRLRDIQELFMDTGVGRDAYCVLGQSDIDAILSPNSEDRKRVFEEAAGVVKFRVRKAEAERRLAETEANLTRLDDILHEIKGQLGPLARQAKKAERYREYTAGLKEAQTLIYADQYQSLRARLQQLQAEVDKLKAISAGEAGKLSASEAALEEKRYALTTLEREQEELRLADLATTKQLEQSNSSLSLAEEKYRNWQAELHRVQEELEALAELAEEGTSQLAQREARVAEAASALKEAEAEVGRAQEEVSRLRALVEESSKKVTSIEEHLFAALEWRNDLRTRLETARSKGEQAQGELARLGRELQELAAEIDSVIESIQGKEGELASLEAKRNQITEDKAQLAQEREELSQELAKAARKLEETKEELSRVHSQYQALKQLDERGEDLYTGVRRVMEEADAGGLAGIIGVVADLLEVPRGFELAVETALGSNVQCIVAQDDLAAEKAIRWLKEKKAGRATFLPLNIVSGRPVPDRELVKLEKISGFLGLAAQQVKAAAELANLKAYLLGRTLIAADLPAARAVAKETGYRYQVVTVDGEIIRPGGSMTGGYQRKNSYGLLARKGRIKELEEAGARLVKLVSTAKEDLSRLSTKDQELAKALHRLDQEYHELRLELVSTEREKNSLEQHKAALEKRKEALATRYNQLSSQSLTQLVVELEEELAQAEREQKDLEARLAEAKAVLQKGQSELDEAKAEAAQAETNLAIKREQYGRFQAELEQVKEQLAALEKRKAENRRRAEAAETGMKQAAEARRQAEQAKEELVQKQAEISRQYKQKREEREALQAQIAEEENRLRSLRREVSELTDRLHQQELELTKLQSDQTALVEKAAEHYGLTEADLQVVNLAAVDLAAAQEKAAELQNKLKMLGPINPEAEKEYQAARERFDFLTEQYNDLLEAKEDLYRVIADIEATVEEQFAAAFNEIQKEFGELFKRLFGGGEAYLKLTDPDDLTATGVEIKARPPGKKLQDLALLSTGERSLTAIALLMAILKVNPAPFTVLDEVDAALDEANLERFGELLVEFSQKTQFIVITHRRRTMEVAGTLYGVTMQKSKGYSEVVSVKLSDIE